MSKEGLCREEQTREEEGRRDREVKEKGEERGKERREEGHLGVYLLDCEFVFLFLILCIQFLF